MVMYEMIPTEGLSRGEWLRLRKTGLECKTASVYQANQWKDGKIPPHYLIQCLHYMPVTGKKAWYIAVVVLGREFKYTKIERDERMLKNLVAVEQACS